ncbi:coat protein [Dill cryptic virus 1]|uniref:coat protein n=1 Tax=Dill cryptic virus 1 TaxID=1408895 RepID=UPI0003BA0A57|nr:coat protein [Dill cryptic virus 1]AGY36137.1 coat protein [Dill cryptic virus 1]
MDPNVPIAQPNGPAIPNVAAAAANPPPPIQPAPPAPGAVQQAPAPAPRRNRLPHGPVPTSSRTAVTSAPALLELAAATPMYTEQRRATNFFVPDSQMLFHVLSICDQMMNSTERFLRSSPAWMPIVSQLYISVLWNVMILNVFVNSGYGSAFSSFLSELYGVLRIDECMIPGPLVPFFQALAAVNGPFDWIGDIVPGLPNFSALWNEAGFYANSNYARQVPIPALILDQLHYFSQYAIPANQQSTYATFEWYRNVFQQGLGAMNRLNRIGPQLCGSLFTTQAEYDAARNFWNASLNTGITRANAAEGQPAFNNYRQLFGFESQLGALQLNWFTSVSIAMNKYTQFFNGSVPLKSILPTGIGAVVIAGSPVNNPSTRTWIYPPDTSIEPFTTTRYPPRREIPDAMAIQFAHSDHELEEQAEQYAMLTHTNIKWHANLTAQNNWTAITADGLYLGDYWNMMPYRFFAPLHYKAQFAQIIASRYHQQAANRAE